jgi:hypothetical protein
MFVAIHDITSALNLYHHLMIPFDGGDCGGLVTDY